MKRVIAKILTVTLMFCMVLIPAESMAASSFNKAKSVTKLTVTAAGYNYVSLKWDKFQGATSYKVYRATSKNGTYRYIKTTGSTAYKNTSLKTGKRYYYKVRAYSSKIRANSKYSSKVSAVPTMRTPAVTLVSTGTGITVNWGKISGAAGYQVYRSTGGSYSRVVSTKSTSWTDKSKTKGVKYYYRVRAYRYSGGKTVYSSFAPVKSEMCAPGRVGSVTAKSTNGGINVTWKAVSGATGYEVVRAVGGSTKYTVCSTVTSKTSYKDTKVIQGEVYFYKVRAYRTYNGKKIYGDYSYGKYSREKVVSTAVAWLGATKGGKIHKSIIDLYNSVSPLPRNYKVRYTDHWCATYVSAVAIKSGMLDIMPRECGCEKMIGLYKAHKVSKWVESDSYVPAVGDLIMYCWSAPESGDCTKTANHVGIVTASSGGKITVIEGNTTFKSSSGKTLQSSTVAYRTINVNYRYTRGFCVPKYESGMGEIYTPPSVAKNNTVMLMNVDGETVQIEEAEETVKNYDEHLDAILTELNKGEMNTQKEKMEYIVNYVSNEIPVPSGEDVGSYYGRLIFDICEETGIEATLENAEDENGDLRTWNVVALDGKTHMIDLAKSTAITECIIETGGSVN